VALVLSRQPLATLDRSRYAAASGVARGAYVLADPPDGEPEVILIATGSEVAMTVEAYQRLTADGIRARVVSMPSMQLFDQQSQSYRDEVLPPAVTARVSVEKGSTFGWDRWVGPTGAIIGMSTFGASAPMKVLQAKFGFTPENIVAAARAQLGLAHTEPPGVTLEALNR
jgi:transketolase